MLDISSTAELDELHGNAGHRGGPDGKEEAEVGDAAGSVGDMPWADGTMPHACQPQRRGNDYGILD